MYNTIEDLCRTAEERNQPMWMEILEDEMRAVAANLYVTTDDGSYGFHGTGTAQLQELWDQGVRL